MFLQKWKQMAGLVVCMLASTHGWAADLEPQPELTGLKMLDPVVVTASRRATPLSQVGSSLTVISKAELQAQGIQNVGEALNKVPGVEIVKSGGPGQLAESYIRGAESGRTLVMINGVEINDAISPGRAVDFSHLSVDNVERIEVLRGPQSAIYGSGAMGGVVNIITQQQAKKWNGSVKVSGGKYSTWDTAAEASGSCAGLETSLGASWGYTKGFSAAKRTGIYAEPLPDMEPNGYREWNLDLGLGYALSPEWTTHATYRFGRQDSQLDYFAGDAGDTANFIKNSLQQAGHWDFQGHVNTWWQQTLNVGLSQDDREYRDAPLPSVENVSTYHGRNLNLDWQHQLDWADFNSTVVGVNYKQEQGRSQDPQYGDYFDEQSTHWTGVYVEDRIAQWGAALNVSARWDVYDRYGTRMTYRLAPLYTWDPSGTSVRGSFGTGFSAPSLYQLYSSYGNLDLQPETSQGWDVGMEQTLGADCKIGVAYFHTDFAKQISYDFNTNRYSNLNQVQTKGWEVFAIAMPVEDLTIRLGYTKLTANDLTQQDTMGPIPLERRADYKWTCDAGYQWQALRANLSAQYVGPRWGKENSERVTLKPYTLVDLNMAYTLSSAWEVFAKIDNVLDAEYIEVVGYNTLRFSAQGGIKFSWQ